MSYGFIWNASVGSPELQGSRSEEPGKVALSCPSSIGLVAQRDAEYFYPGARLWKLLGKELRAHQYLRQHLYRGRAVLPKKMMEGSTPFQDTHKDQGFQRTRLVIQEGGRRPKNAQIVPKGKKMFKSLCALVALI